MAEIREKTRESNIGFIIKKLKLGYADHLERGGREK